MRRTIQTRLLLWGLGLFLSGLAVVFVAATRTVNADLVQETELRARRELTTIKWLIVHRPAFENEQEFDTWTKNLGDRLGTRITFIADGKVLADSMVAYTDLSGLDDHGPRPEIIAAASTTISMSRRYSDTLGRDMIYAALSLPPSAGLPRGVIRVAAPVSEITDRVGSLRTNFLLLTLLVLSVTGLLLLMMTRSASRSILAFSDMARDIGAGDYSRRIRQVPAGEFQGLATSVNTMADHIQEHIATIEDQRAQLGAMFEGLSEGVLVLDSFGRIESFNRAVAVWFPQLPAYTGRTPMEATMNLAIQDVVDQILAEPDTGLVENELALEGGLHLAISAVPFQDRKGVRKVVLVFHDVTETRRGERMLRDFVANASHQLRTPLTSIKGYAETLRASPPDDPDMVKSFLATIERNAGHMSDVVTSLLALAKSEQLKRTENRPVDAGEVLRQAAANLAPRAAKNQMRIKVELPVDPVFVRTDAEGLLHILHNLIENAAKYGPKETPITVSLTPEGKEAVFLVCDRGSGIPKEHRERIFERFYRVDENTIAGDGSAGLGLAICRQIVENYGGKISYVSRPEAGNDTSCFRFTLKMIPSVPEGLSDTGPAPTLPPNE
ncbi:MAG: HAMP domain-containing protein [Proteobacteria bacterium]|nr:HAMP domain-containing protein [Pseudomonadota bacterium]